MEEQDNRQVYYGTKRIVAWPQQKETSDGLADGYAVKYEDGYTSWSPKEVFERAYIPLSSLLEPPTEMLIVMDEINVTYAPKE